MLKVSVCAIRTNNKWTGTCVSTRPSLSPETPTSRPPQILRTYLKSEHPQNDYQCGIQCITPGGRCTYSVQALPANASATRGSLYHASGRYPTDRTRLSTD